MPRLGGGGGYMYSTDVGSPVGSPVGSHVHNSVHAAVGSGVPPMVGSGVITVGTLATGIVGWDSSGSGRLVGLGVGGRRVSRVVGR